MINEYNNTTKEELIEEVLILKDELNKARSYISMLMAEFLDTVSKYEVVLNLLKEDSND